MTREKHNGAIFLASLGRPRKMRYACRGKTSIRVILGCFFIFNMLRFSEGDVKNVRCLRWSNTVRSSRFDALTFGFPGISFRFLQDKISLGFSWDVFLWINFRNILPFRFLQEFILKQFFTPICDIMDFSLPFSSWYQDFSYTFPAFQPETE